MNIEFDNPWKSIEIPPEKEDLNLVPITEEFYWGKDHRGLCMLVYMLTGNGTELPESFPDFKHLDIGYKKGYGGQLFWVKLLDTENIRLFHRLSTNILEDISINKPKSDNDVIIRIIQSTRRLHDFISMESNKNMSVKGQMGLIGEILVLDQYLLESDISALEAVQSWALGGPYPKDFRINKVGIEAKTRTGGKSEIHISSDEQLDSYGLEELFICVTDLEVSSSEHVNSFSLTDKAKEIKKKLMDTEYEAVVEYETHLSSKGFWFYQDYKELFWLKSNTVIYTVEDDFPAITPSDISDGVIDVEYKIDMNECDDFIVNKQILIDSINNNQSEETSSDSVNKVDRIKQLISEGENKNVEFKSTFSKPLDVTNSKNLSSKQLQKEVQTASLKTITAFMNTDGGNLLIGVKEDPDNPDNTIIIGIESDKYENKDKYIRTIVQHVQSRIGKNYSGLIDIELVEIDGKNVCNIKCPDSDSLQKKKFSPAPLKQDFSSNESQDKYYVRSAGRTDEITGSEIVDLMQRWVW